MAQLGGIAPRYEAWINRQAEIGKAGGMDDTWSRVPGDTAYA
ncbi:MAG: hypothetical protein ABI808_11190 [Pseudonocardiales bacterium]